MEELDIKALLEQTEKKLGDAVEGKMDTKAKEVFKLEIKSTLDKLNGEIEEKVKTKADTSALLEVSEKLEKMQNTVENLEIKLKKEDIFQAPEAKSLPDLIKQQIEAKHDDFEKFIRKERGFERIGLDLKAVGDVSTANVTGGTAWGNIMRPGIIESPKRKVHMRQILPGGNIGPGTQFVFMREDGDGEGAIAPVAEGATKPQIDVDLIESSVNIETIAGWLRVTTKAMNNIPGFISFLQSRLPEKLLRIEDTQVLYGNGTSPNLKGILTAGNFQASTAAASEVLIEKIIDDIATLEDTYERDATGILLRPKDYYGFFKNKAAGSGEYDLPQGVTFVNGVLYVFGIPAWASTAITDGDYVVGDFDMGAQLLTQEGMRLEFFNQDADNVTKNKVTVRIEETVALPVYGDNYFIKGSTTVTPEGA